jgi:glucosylceramidase
MSVNMSTGALLGIVLFGTVATLGASGSPDGTVAVYITAKNTGQQLTKVANFGFTHLPQPTEQEPCIFVDPTKTFQTLLGIGGALTDASAETFYKLPKDKQQELIRAYFDPQKPPWYFHFIRMSLSPFKIYKPGPL